MLPIPCADLHKEHFVMNNDFFFPTKQWSDFYLSR